LRKALTHGRVLGLAFVYFGNVYGLYALGFFLPTIIAGFQQQFGATFSIIQRGLITAIPYVVGAVAMVLWARHGDRTGERVWHVALPMLVGGVTIPVALYLRQPGRGDGRGDDHRGVHLLCASHILGVAVDVPGGHRGGRRDRVDQRAGNLSGFAAP